MIFVVIEIRIGKIQEMCFYLIFCFLGFKDADKLTINLSEGSEDIRFFNFIRLGREI